MSGRSEPPTPLGWILLIGVDFYLPGVKSLKTAKKNLTGCVRDANGLADYFTGALNVPPERIIKLTSTAPPTSGSVEGLEQPLEEPHLWPTGENIRSALRFLLKEAARGDVVFIHYSGHGTRVATKWPQHKGGKDKHDEALVPCDFRRGGRIIRDFELGDVLHQMGLKGLSMTIVLDCCYSGGATREGDDVGGTNVAVRGLDGESVDDTELPEGERFLMDDEVVSVAKLPAKDDADSMLNLAWRDESPRYEMFAACRSNEKALEKDGHGALSHALIEALTSCAPHVPTHGALFRRVKAVMTAMKLVQHPGFSGNGRRIFLSARNTADVATISLAKEVLYRKEFFSIQTGSVHGLVKDTEFLIYPWHATDFSKESALAKAKVSSVGNSISYVTLVKLYGSNHGLPDSTYQAVQYRLPDEYKVKVHLGETAQDSHTGLRDTVLASGFIAVVDSEDVSADHYSVTLDNDGTLLLRKGGQPIPYLPRIPTPTSLVAMLSHLHKYSRIMQVDSRLPSATLVTTVASESFEFGLAGGHTADETGTFHLYDGDSFVFRFKNTGSKVLSLAVLNLQPRYSISQVYPVSADEYFAGWVRPGKDRVKPSFRSITMRLPPCTGTEPVIDIFKVFVSTESVDFRFLEQKSAVEALDKNGEAAVPPRFGDPFAGDLRSSGDKADYWTTATIRVSTRRRT